jgi:ariadne-1
VQSINEVAEVVRLPNTTVHILLNLFKWDKEKLMEQLYSDNDQEALQEAQEALQEAQDTFQEAQVPAAVYSPMDEQECGICADKKPVALMAGLECGHMYCNACWTDYLTTKIMDDGDSQMIECPGSCKAVVNDQMVMKLITASRVKQKYKHLITNSFVQYNR